MLGLCEPSSEPLAARSRKQTHPEPSPPASTATSRPSVSAVEMGARQREISVSEFFTKNRHLLGFDNPRKALLTCVKEAVDNALDACEEAGILPDVVIKVEVAANGEAAPPASQATRFRITVTDNGPGIVRQQIPTIIANPHVKLTYLAPEGESKAYRRTFEQLPASPREIKPHPYGIELGMLLKMLQDTTHHTLSGFLSADFSRVSPNVADGICKSAGLSPRARPRDVHGQAAESLYKAIQATKIMAPPTNCLSPIGEPAILSGLYQQIKGEFYTAVSRPPAVYRGNPFIIEAGLAYGRGPEQAPPAQAKKAVPLAEGVSHDGDDELARVIRYANRVPLLYQPSACAITRATLDTSWRNYGISQSRGSLPAGPMVIFVHMASVWVPFTSESKEAIAEYDEIHKEISLALRECGRRLGAFLRRRERAHSEFRRRNIFELYIEEIVQSCNRLKGGRLATAKLKDQLLKMATKITGGGKTDELLGKNGSGPEGLPHSIIVTPEGVEGEVPAVSPNGAPAADEPVAPPAAPEARAPRKTKGKATPKPRAGRKKKR